MASVRRRTWKTATGEAKSAWIVDYTDSRGDRQRKHFLNKKAADAFRIHIEGQMQAGTYRPNADKVTVKEVCESFLEHCAGRNERDENCYSACEARGCGKWGEIGEKRMGRGSPMRHPSKYVQGFIDRGRRQARLAKRRSKARTFCPQYMPSTYTIKRFSVL
jgi:hypothetical protein